MSTGVPVRPWRSRTAASRRPGEIERPGARMRALHARSVPKRLRAVVRAIEGFLGFYALSIGARPPEWGSVQGHGGWNSYSPAGGGSPRGPIPPPRYDLGGRR